MAESFSGWSRDWKSLRKWTKDPSIYDRVLEQWRKPVPSECLGRELLRTLGMRKNTDLYRGEMVIESRLLGLNGFTKRHTIATRSAGIVELLALYNNQALARIKQGDNGQVIADVLGVLKVGTRNHPLAIEVKEANGADSWYAVVQNLQQIRILRANVRCVEDNLREHAVDAVGTWGMVLAPTNYWSRPGELRLEEATKLLQHLRSATRARVLLASHERSSGEIRLVGGQLYDL